MSKKSTTNKKDAEKNIDNTADIAAKKPIIFQTF